MNYWSNFNKTWYLTNLNFSWGANPNQPRLIHTFPLLIWQTVKSPIDACILHYELQWNRFCVFGQRLNKKTRAQRVLFWTGKKYSILYHIHSDTSPLLDFCFTLQWMGIKLNAFRTYNLSLFKTDLNQIYEWQIFLRFLHHRHLWWLQ